MTWTVVSPVIVASEKAIIVTVDIPMFIDEIQYEDILGRAFSKPSDMDRLASGMVIVLATPDGRNGLAQIHDSVAHVPVEETLMRLALGRQIVALRWTPTN